MYVPWSSFPCQRFTGEVELGGLVIIAEPCHEARVYVSRCLTRFFLFLRGGVMTASCLARFPLKRAPGAAKP
jgi:hypothetical protein